VIRNRVYVTADGLQVTLRVQTWRDHIQQRHPEVTLADVEQALTHPARICDHRHYVDQQIYEGTPGTTPPGRRSFPVVVVERRSPTTGVVVTARVSRRPYGGVQRWP
jgi:hypothetical protein